MGRRGDDGAVRRTAGPGPDRAEAPAQRGRMRGPCPTARSWSRRSASTWSTTPASRPASAIETRLLVRQQGEWDGLSYSWNAEQTDADLVPAAGAAEELEVADPSDPSGRREQTWRFPARTECLVCHSRAAGFVLGFTPLQLDRDHDYGGVVDNQLRTLEHIGVFKGKLPRQARARLTRIWSIPTTPRPRSRPGSGHTCMSTARPATSWREAATLPWSWVSPVPLAKMRLIDEAPQHDRFGIPDARLVAPGSPERSVPPRTGSRAGEPARCRRWCPPRSTAPPSK